MALKTSKHFSWVIRLNGDVAYPTLLKEERFAVQIV